LLLVDIRYCRLKGDVDQISISKHSVALKHKLKTYVNK